MGELYRIYKNNSDGQLKDYQPSKRYEETNLVFDETTLIIYYQFEVNGVGYMAPYISENGKYCRFINEKIVEVG